ncbi:MAG TPA: 4'-phosphopantetheinyl transferase superfamily protein [Chitinophagaceae bacterium]|nr:4'-phosphopantetheinyl transferase superfamily protein [Chitinophagaceae bacterium]
MPVFFQHQINEYTRLGVWKIEESEDFFKRNVPVHRDVTHPHKRLQHLAGRFLLQYLFPDFPYGLIQIADTRKPFLPNEQYHFSISHCADYAAAIVSSKNRVGVDVEIPKDKISVIADKYISSREKEKIINNQAYGNQAPDSQLLTLLWSAKESVFKWHGDGGVDFRQHIQLFNQQKEKQTIDCFFAKNGSELVIHYRVLDSVVLAWVLS